MIVLDSSFLIAYHNKRDTHHEAASDVMARFLDGEWGHGLLLEYVVLEVATVLALRQSVDAATAVGDALLGAREVEFVPCSALFLDTYRTFRAQKRGALSFVDAAIVALARQRGISNVATFDSEFGKIDGIKVIPA